MMGVESCDTRSGTRPQKDLEAHIHMLVFDSHGSHQEGNQDENLRDAPSGRGRLLQVM
jgi:hypothetical protein